VVEPQPAAPIVRVEPSGIEIVVRRGQTLMAAARAQGYYWPNQCNMECRCSNCFVIVEAGVQHLSPMGRAERATLLEQRGRKALDRPVRLACQTMVAGDATVQKRGVRPA
jgi:2Fe-2S ferredoxin